jgi:hypothetical protein
MENFTDKRRGFAAWRKKTLLIFAIFSVNW